MADPNIKIDAANEAATRAGSQVRKAILGFLNKESEVGLVSRTVANLAGALIAMSAVLVIGLFGVLFRIASVIAEIFLTGIEAARRDNQDSLNGVVAASMSDLLSVEVDPADIPSGGTPRQQLDRAVAIGSKLHDLLLFEFGGGSGPSGVDGEKAARAFTGFNINFSVSAAILSIVTEIESLGFLKEWREVGEEMAQNLGLGRLHRSALKPLIDTLIVKPYTRELNERYRQDLLTDQQYVNAVQRGTIDLAAARQALAQKGFSEAYVDELMEQLLPRLTPQDVDVLVSLGKITPFDGLKSLTGQGWSPTFAQNKLDAIAGKELIAQERAYADELLTLVKAIITLTPPQIWQRMWVRYDYRPV